MDESVKSKSREKKTIKSDKTDLDRELTDTFPASDPPSSIQPNVAIGQPIDRKKSA